MDSIRVWGGTPLQGKVRIQGSKNAALPVIAASVMIRDRVLLQNVPKITDVYNMLHILKDLGCSVRWTRNLLEIDSSGTLQCQVAGRRATGMRSSVFLLGALLARGGRANVENPGGCVIGKRPIDMHVKALEAIGVRFENHGTALLANADAGLNAASVKLDFPSVGATENVIMAATAAVGVTRISGAAREPEVRALCEFLKGAGAIIKGIGTSELVIRGGISLRGTEFRVPPDRIVAGTYLYAGFMAGGSVFLEDAPAGHMEACLKVARQMGARVVRTQGGLYAWYPRRANALPLLKTEVYPGFPTDLQSAALAVSCKAQGKSVIRETIFEDRFRMTEALRKMGADVRHLDERSVETYGKEELIGANVEALELRGGAALVIAALGAKGETVIAGRHYIDRGYENICRDLRELGARIVCE